MKELFREQDITRVSYYKAILEAILFPQRSK